MQIKLSFVTLVGRKGERRVTSHPISHPWYREVFVGNTGCPYLCGPFGTMERISRTDAALYISGRASPVR